MLTTLCACLLWLHVNGLSHHSVGDYNETNLGLGASVETVSGERWHGSLGLDVYRDSNNNDSGHLVQTLMRRLGPVSVGLAAGVMHRKDVRAVTGHSLFPVLLPILSVGTQRIRVRGTYVPALTDGHASVGAIQLQVRL